MVNNHMISDISISHSGATVNPTDASPEFPGDSTHPLTVASPSLYSGTGILPVSPIQDTRWFQLPDSVRSKVETLLAIVHVIDSAANKKAALLAQASHCGNAPGFTYHSLRTKYYKWIRSGRDWFSLVDCRASGPNFYQKKINEREALAYDFLEYWRELCQRNQRKYAPARRLLLRIWRTHIDDSVHPPARVDKIPGYNNAWPKADPSHGHPAGWSKENLYRHGPTKQEKVAAQQGRKALAAHRPLVMRSRRELELGQFQVFDDVDHDFECYFAEQTKPLRIQQFHGLDILAGYQMCRGYRPQVIDYDTGKRTHLKEKDFLFLLTHSLMTNGYRATGTHLLMEHGTTTLPEKIIALLSDMTGGKIVVEMGAIQKDSTHAGLYEAAGKGNYRFKAHIESWHNLLHNETGFIPGQVGKNRDYRPEELHGRQKHAIELSNAVAALALSAPERAAKLLFPFLNYNDSIWALNDIQDRINDRTDHDLEGWVDLGFTTFDYRLELDTENWKSQEQLLKYAEPQRSIIAGWVKSTPGALRARKMSPREVWNRGKHNLVKLAPHHAALLLWHTGTQREVPVRSAQLQFEDETLGPEPFNYLAVIHPVQGATYIAHDDDKYSTVVNPFDLDRLFLFDSRGRYIGWVERTERPSLADTDAIKRQIGKKAAIEHTLLNDVAKRGMPEARRKLAIHENNIAVLGATPEEKAEQRTLRKLKRQETQEEEPSTDTQTAATLPIML